MKREKGFKKFLVGLIALFVVGLGLQVYYLDQSADAQPTVGARVYVPISTGEGRPSLTFDQRNGYIENQFHFDTTNAELYFSVNVTNNNADWIRVGTAMASRDNSQVSPYGVFSCTTCTAEDITIATETVTTSTIATASITTLDVTNLNVSSSVTIEPSGVSELGTWDTGVSGFNVDVANLDSDKTYTVDVSDAISSSDIQVGDAGTGVTVTVDSLDITVAIDGTEVTFVNDGGITPFVLYDPNGQIVGTSTGVSNIGYLPDADGDSITIVADYANTKWWIKSSQIQ